MYLMSYINVHKTFNPGAHMGLECIRSGKQNLLQRCVFMKPFICPHHVCIIYVSIYIYIYICIYTYIYIYSWSIPERVMETKHII